MEYYHLWEHQPAPPLTDPFSDNFTFKKYYHLIKSKTPNISTVQPPQSEQIKKFIQWADSNGVQHPKIIYPVYYSTPEGFSFPGMITTAKVKANEIFVRVPSKIILSTQVAYNSELKAIFKLYPDMFTKEGAEAWEDYVLIAYIIWQISIGEKSMWKPMFDIWPKQIELFYRWSGDDFKELQNYQIYKEASEENECLKRSWNDLYKILAKYPQYFPKHMLIYDIYIWIWELLCSRIFNSKINTTSFVPFAELVNHENVDSHYDQETTEDSNVNASKTEEASSGDESNFEYNKDIAYCHQKGKKYEYVPSNIEPIESEAVAPEEIKNPTQFLERYENIEKQFGEDKPYNHILLNFNKEYEKGQQIYMSYGKDTNAYLLCNYGFILEYNKYDYYKLQLSMTDTTQKQLFLKYYSINISVKAFVPESYFIKIYYQHISPKLIMFSKILLLDAKSNPHLIKDVFDISFEENAINKAIKLLENAISQMPTTLSTDFQLLKNKQYPNSHIYFAIKYRIEQKKILHHQIFLLNIILAILKRIVEHKPYKEAIAKVSIEPDNEFAVALNRRMIHSYLIYLKQNV